MLFRSITFDTIIIIDTAHPLGVPLFVINDTVINTDRDPVGFALRAPYGIPGASFVFEEFPDLDCCLALDLSQHHHDYWNVFLFGKIGDVGMIHSLIFALFTTRCRLGSQASAGFP